MLFNLVRKDFLLAKKYLLFSIIFSVISPIFITIKINSSSQGFWGFLITVIFLEYMLFNTVSMSEDKYKGAMLICTTPYTRSALVKAKYIFILMIFICTYIIYTITALAVPIDINQLNIFNLGISFLIVTIYFGITIPIQYKFGYEKIRYATFTFMFILPFVLPNIVNWFQSNHIIYSNIIPFSQIAQTLICYLFSVAIGFISMILSIHIYSKKDL